MNAKLFEDTVKEGATILMEGALGKRLKREYKLDFSGPAAMASLVYSREGRAALKALWSEYMQIANDCSLPFMATTPTRRANILRIRKSGLPISTMTDNISFLRKIADESPVTMFVGGMLGCFGDAYSGSGCLEADASYRLHRWQARALTEAGADFLFAAIMPTVPETIGMAEALSETGLPYIISFTLRPDGLVIDGTRLNDAISAIDSVTSNRPPLCYMTNCIHPSFVESALSFPFNQTNTVRERFKGIQANSAALPYSTLDCSGIPLHTSTPKELATGMARLKRRFGLTIFGGCCGTDGSYLRAIAKALSE